MQPRSVEEWINIVKQSIRNDETILSSLLTSSQSVQVQDISGVLAAQIDSRKQQLDVLSSLHSFGIERSETLALLDKLDGDFKDWESAIQDNAEKGVSDFLDAADSITDRMGKNLDTLLQKRRDQVSREIHIPPTRLDSSLQTLVKKSSEIDAKIKKIPAPDEETDPLCYLAWKRVNNMQTGRDASLKGNIAYLERVSKENLGETIEKYKTQVQKLTKTYNDLADVEQGVEVKLEDSAEAKQVKVLRGEREAQLAAMPSFDGMLQKPSSNDESLLQLIAEKKDSPPVSFSDSEISGSSSEDEDELDTLKGKTKDSPRSSSALVGSFLGMQLRSSTTADKLTLSPDKEMKQQVASAASKAPSHIQQDHKIGLVSKLGFIAPPLQQPTPESGINVSSTLIQRRSSLTSIR